MSEAPMNVDAVLISSEMFSRWGWQYTNVWLILLTLS